MMLEWWCRNSGLFVIFFFSIFCCNSLRIMRIYGQTNRTLNSSSQSTKNYEFIMKNNEEESCINLQVLLLCFYMLWIKPFKRDGNLELKKSYEVKIKKTVWMFLIEPFFVCPHPWKDKIITIKEYKVSFLKHPKIWIYIKKEKFDIKLLERLLSIFLIFIFGCQRNYYKNEEKKKKNWNGNLWRREKEEDHKVKDYNFECWSVEIIIQLSISLFS